MVIKTHNQTRPSYMKTSRAVTSIASNQSITIQNILVPIDFSETSLCGLAPAKGLARRFGATVHVTNVHEPYYPGSFFEPQIPFAGVPWTDLENTRESAEKQLIDLTAKHKLTGSCEVEVGGPAFEGICRVAHRVRADLIVACTHGRGGVQRVLLGSTAERLVQHSPCPVLVIREKRNAESPGTTTESLSRIKTIVVPVDFSHTSLDGLQYAIRFASKVKARILVVTVVQFGYAFTTDGYAIYDLTPLEKAARAAAEREMQLFIRRVRFGPVKFETAIEIGKPMRQICAFAESRRADLIITPTHGYSGLKHVLIGSTAEHVVRGATCPVLVVPSHPGCRIGQIASRTEPQLSGSRLSQRPVFRKRSISSRTKSNRLLYKPVWPGPLGRRAN